MKTFLISLIIVVAGLSVSFYVVKYGTGANQKIFEIFEQQHATLLKNTILTFPKPISGRSLSLSGVPSEIQKIIPSGAENIEARYENGNKNNFLIFGGMSSKNMGETMVSYGSQIFTATWRTSSAAYGASAAIREIENANFRARTVFLIIDDTIDFGVHIIKK